MPSKSKTTVRRTKKNITKPKALKRLVKKDVKQDLGELLGSGLKTVAKQIPIVNTLMNFLGWGTYEEGMTGNFESREGELQPPPVDFDVAENSLLGSSVTHTANGTNHVAPMFEGNFSKQIPMMHSPNGIGATNIKHREFCRNVLQSDVFHSTYFYINPLNNKLFPWLYTMAQNFEQFRINGMVFEYRSTSSPVAISASTPALGVVAMATQYDVNSPPYINMTEALNSTYATSCKPSQSMFHPIECAPDERGVSPRYTYNWRITQQNQGSFLSSAADPFCCLGKMAFLSEGTFLGDLSPTAIAGQLWVTYDVDFFKPIVSQVSQIIIPIGVVFSTGPDGKVAPLDERHLEYLRRPGSMIQDKMLLRTLLQHKVVNNYSGTLDENLNSTPIPEEKDHENLYHYMQSTLGHCIEWSKSKNEPAPAVFHPSPPIVPLERSTAVQSYPPTSNSQPILPTNTYSLGATRL